VIRMIILVAARFVCGGSRIRIWTSLTGILSLLSGCGISGCTTRTSPFLVEKDRL
jgi:hypothetical protein